MVSSLIRNISFASTVLVIGFFTSVLDLTLGRIGLMPVQPTQLAVMLLGCLACGELVCAMRNTQRSIRLTSSMRILAAPIACYTAMASLALLLASLEGAYWAEMSRWIFLVPLGWIMWVCCLIVSVQPPLCDAARKGVFLGFVMLSGSVIYEIFVPASFSNLFGRASGFAGNSNFGALATSMLLAAVLKYGEPGTRFRDLMCLLIGLVAVAATQSRSGLIECFLVIVVWGASFIGRPVLPLRQLVKLFAIAFLLVTVAIGGISIMVSQGELFSSQSSRFAKMLAGKDVDDGAADERIQVALEAIELISESPIFGHGTGHVRMMRIPPHNQYLQQWVNNGIFGLLAYLLLIVSSLVIFARRRFFPGLAFITVAGIGSFFSHNIVDQRTFILVLAILLAQVAGSAQSDLAIPELQESR